MVRTSRTQPPCGRRTLCGHKGSQTQSRRMPPPLVCVLSRRGGGRASSAQEQWPWWWSPHTPRAGVRCVRPPALRAGGLFAHGALFRRTRAHPRGASMSAYLATAVKARALAFLLTLASPESTQVTCSLMERRQDNQGLHRSRLRIRPLGVTVQLRHVEARGPWASPLAPQDAAPPVSTFPRADRSGHQAKERVGDGDHQRRIAGRPRGSRMRSLCWRWRHS
jgi:hypothetical protein